MKRAFKIKSIFHHFKGLSLKEIKQIFFVRLESDFKKIRCGEDLLLFSMMLDIASGHLLKLCNNICTRKRSPTGIDLFKLKIRNNKKSMKYVQS